MGHSPGCPFVSRKQERYGNSTEPGTVQHDPRGDFSLLVYHNR